jgi:hypothetical protein
LGIGQLRDLYSELLFPGFSSIQTRSRYLLAIAKILRDWADQTPAGGNWCGGNNPMRSSYLNVYWSDR